MNDVRVPASAADLTAGWLRGILAGQVPAELPGLTVARIGAEFGLASELYRVHGGEWSVVVKLWDTSSVAGTREVRFFQTFAPDTGPKVPACHFAAIDDALERAVLVLEDLHDVEQGDCLTRLTTKPAVLLAQSLAALHATWWNRPELANAEWLLTMPPTSRDDAWYAERRDLVLTRFEARLNGVARDIVDDGPMVASYARRQLTDVAPTLLHRDLHLDNILFDLTNGEPILLDWALASRGAAIHDVVKLVFTIAELDDFDTVVNAYVAELRRRGVGELWRDELIRQLGPALLLFVVNDTYGKARWEPGSPREEKIIDTEITRVVQAVEFWQRRQPELFDNLR
ncbi:phosphotransferase family protein [Phytoactinopolyspora endophytica]|uniref:phosphotransferase family protein n=1 Tax=Phytoactinopolyspora endophytica TaxID=1642495 RepID=UPI0013EDA214|nr:aminoglycoside phosphotransferase family protein [Phytoactinopolyspora endophytica]